MATKSLKTSVKKVASKKMTTGSDRPVLDPRIFEYPVSEALLTQVLHVYRDNSHQDTSRVKTRGELTKTTKKIYKQKGTGNARHGSRMSPTFVGGGVAHGPTGVQPKNLKINRKMRASALAGILSLYAKNKMVELVVLPDLKTPKVSSVKQIFPQKGTLLVCHQEDKAVVSSVSNLANVTVIDADRLNAYLVVQNKHLALTQAAALALTARLLPLLKTKTT